MTTTAVLWRGSELSYAENVDGWYAYINGGDYLGDQQGKLTGAPMAAQEDEFDDLLPDNCFWHPHTSEITGPVDAVLDIDLNEAMREACQVVIDRFEEIEREALGK